MPGIINLEQSIGRLKSAFRSSSKTKNVVPQNNPPVHHAPRADEFTRSAGSVKKEKTSRFKTFIQKYIKGDSSKAEAPTVVNAARPQADHNSEVIPPRSQENEGLPSFDEVISGRSKDWQVETTNREFHFNHQGQVIGHTDHQVINPQLRSHYDNHERHYQHEVEQGRLLVERNRQEERELQQALRNSVTDQPRSVTEQSELDDALRRSLDKQYDHVPEKADQDTTAPVSNGIHVKSPDVRPNSEIKNFQEELDNSKVYKKANTGEASIQSSDKAKSVNTESSASLFDDTTSISGKSSQSSQSSIRSDRASASSVANRTPQQNDMNNLFLKIAEKKEHGQNPQEEIFHLTALIRNNPGLQDYEKGGRNIATRINNLGLESQHLDKLKSVLREEHSKKIHANSTPDYTFAELEKRTQMENLGGDFSATNRKLKEEASIQERRKMLDYHNQTFGYQGASDRLNEEWRQKRLQEIALRNNS